MNANVEKLKEFMKENNYNQSKFANALGLTRGSVNRIINGKRNPGGRFMSAFKHKFPQESLDDFFYI